MQTNDHGFSILPHNSLKMSQNTNAKIFVKSKYLPSSHFILCRANYPGRRIIDQLSKDSDKESHNFNRSEMPSEGLNIDPLRCSSLIYIIIIALPSSVSAGHCSQEMNESCGTIIHDFQTLIFTNQDPKPTEKLLKIRFSTYSHGWGL